MSALRKRPPDWKSVACIAAAVLISSSAAYLGQPLVHNNAEARGVIVNVFSILAGFLITIMTLLGEPGLVRGSTWRRDAAKRENIRRRLLRQKALFLIYLITLALIFVTTVVAEQVKVGPLVEWCERAYLGFATFGFIFSLLLPSKLMSHQMARLDELIETRKEHGHD